MYLKDIFENRSCSFPILTILLGLLNLTIVKYASASGEPAWDVIKPSNTGIPGELVRFAKFGPQGEMWVAARWPFWGEGGVGIYNFDTQLWTTYSNVDTPVPGEYINDIEFVGNNVVWLATDQGLVKKDGNTWTIFNTDNAPLLHNVIRNIDIDSAGNIWVNNSRTGDNIAALFKFDGISEWQQYTVGQELPWDPPWNSLGGLVVDASDHVWVGNNTLNGVAEYDGNTWVLHGAGTTRFKSIIEDGDGNLWMLPGVGGGNTFYKFNGTTFTAYDASNTPFTNITLTSLAFDEEDGYLYAGNWAGQVIRTINSGASWSLFATQNVQIYSIAPQPNSDHVYVTTPGSARHLDANGIWQEAFNTYNTGMPWYWIDRMTTDRDGYFWFATGEAGLSRFDGQSWRNWGNHNAQSEPYPFAGNELMGSAYQDTTGTHWFGGNGIARWESKTSEFTGFWNWKNNPGMGVTLFTFFAEDAAGNMFAATKYGAIFRFNTQQQLWISESVNPYSGGNLPGMQSDSDGNVWIAAWFSIHKWNGNAWSFVTLPHGDYFFDLGGINDMTIDPDGVFWIGTVEGLVRWDQKTFELFDIFNSPLPLNNVRSVDSRADGVIGLSSLEYASAGAVAIIQGPADDPASWSSYLYGDSPLPHWQLDEVAFDAAGKLWVSALSEGVAVIDIGGATTPGDIDGDGVVGTSDLLILLSNWGPCPDKGECPADLDGDGQIGTSDLLVLLANWG